jgi:hypothetical protein
MQTDAWNGVVIQLVQKDFVTIALAVVTAQTTALLGLLNVPMDRSALA